MNYSSELKEALLRRMLPPNNESITKISREEGISEQTLRNWRDKARADGTAAPGTDAVPDDWSTQDKFLIVVETASMSEAELAEYARKKGLYVEQIKAWRDACMNANGGVAKQAAELSKKLKESERANRQLQKELERKEKALAETAALLVLRKKADAIWGIPRKNDQRLRPRDCHPADQRGGDKRSRTLESLQGAWHLKPHVLQVETSSEANGCCR